MIKTLLQLSKKHPLLKWSLIIFANTSVSLFFAAKFMKYPQGFLGLLLGIVSFVFIYYKFEKYLINTQSKKWHSAFMIAIFLTALALLYPPLPMMSGALSLDTTSSILSLSPRSMLPLRFVATYLTTLIDGGLLSLFVIIITLIIRGIFFLIDTEKSDYIS